MRPVVAIMAERKRLPLSWIQIEWTKLSKAARVRCFCMLMGLVFLYSLIHSFKPLISVSMEAKKVDCPTFVFRPRRLTFLPSWNWRRAMKYVNENELTFLSKETLIFHRDMINEIEKEGVPGMILECGVAKAGSSITFAAIKQSNRCLHLFDTFEGIPEPSEKDGKDVHKRYNKISKGQQDCLKGNVECDENYYGYMANLLAFDERHVAQAGYAQSNVYFHKGLFHDTVWPEGPVAYAHLDGDWYESTMGMLERISPFLSIGGYFVLDDVFHWSGAKIAFTEYFDLDLDWLQQQESKECVRKRDEDGKRYLLFIRERAGAQLLGSEDDEADAVPCAKKSKDEVINKT